MNFLLNLIKKPSRERQIEKTIGEIIELIMRDEINDFTHQEQSEILKTVFDTFKHKKIKERSDLDKYAQSIDDCLDNLK